MINKTDLSKLSKEELIKMVLEMQEKRQETSAGATDEEIAWMEEEHMQNEAYMERHGHIDYGYGVGCWGGI